MATERSSFKIILGSSSESRRKILAEMGYEFTVVTADIDEKSIRKETPEELVMALAEAKADAILSKLQNMDYLEEDFPTLLITADTVVVYKGTIREKPSSKEEARQFVKGYSGSHGGVVGSVLVTNLKTGTRKGGWEKAEGGKLGLTLKTALLRYYKIMSSGNLLKVYFYDIPDKVIDNMIEEGISLNVAGDLMLEHPLILPLVESMVGSIDCVMGLSKALTESLIQEVL